MPQKIIAFTGAKTVGKSTIAKALSQALQDASILSFATPLREMLWSMGVQYEYLHNHKEDKIPSLGKSARELLCSLGTDWGRNMVDENIWVWAMSRQVEGAMKDFVIIDDCRFKNEAEWIKSQGGLIFKLTRDGHEYTNDHVTETPLDQKFIDDVFDCENIEETITQVMDRIELTFDL